MLGKIGDEDPNKNETISRSAKHSFLSPLQYGVIQDGSYIDSTKLKVLGEANFWQWGVKLSIFAIYGFSNQKNNAHWTRAAVDQKHQMKKKRKRNTPIHPCQVRFLQR